MYLHLGGDYMGVHIYKSLSRFMYFLYGSYSLYCLKSENSKIFLNDMQFPKYIDTQFIKNKNIAKSIKYTCKSKKLNI